MYKAILFASDLTEQSYSIGKKAKDLARLFGGRVEVIHVIEPIGAYGGGIYYLGDLSVEIEKLARESLNELANRLEISEGNRHLCMGQTKHEILRIAEEIHADLIMMGTHGAKGFAMLLGSTASSVLNSAKCDVLTIPIRE
ncbi:MAG TPA: universal stress protein [Gammaproteobacteria bacterium]|nr:universal stress protein [Gammaproteobacteria bacterium]